MSGTSSSEPQPHGPPIEPVQPDTTGKHGPSEVTTWVTLAVVLILGLIVSSLDLTDFVIAVRDHNPDPGYVWFNAFGILVGLITVLGATAAIVRKLIRRFPEWLD